MRSCSSSVITGEEKLVVLDINYTLSWFHTLGKDVGIQMFVVCCVETGIGVGDIMQEQCDHS